EAVGLKIDLPPSWVAACIADLGIGFLFAPQFHPAFRFAALPRRELGVRTVFNVLGPLCNPAGAGCRALGVADPNLVPRMADALVRLGVDNALVFNSADLDELSTSGPSQVVELSAGRQRPRVPDPSSLGLPPPSAAALRGRG